MDIIIGIGLGFGGLLAGIWALVRANLHNARKRAGKSKIKIKNE